MKCGIATLWMGLILFASFGSAAEKPNVLFIYTDDHSHRAVGCYPEAYDWVTTPNIDRLAETGVRFSHAYIGTWCMPSRATVLTGHLQTGVESMRMEGRYPSSVYDPEQCPFWPKIFREHGYATAQLGKWHTGIDSGWGRDWDYQRVWNRPKYPENAGQYFYDQWIETNGGEKELVESYATDNYSDWAVEFIENEGLGGGREADQPWFLWVCYGAVHGPFTPADRHMDTYEGVEVPIPTDLLPPREGKPTYARDWGEWELRDGVPVRKGDSHQLTVTTQMVHGNTLNDWVRQYHQGVLAIDEGVGRMLAALDATGQRENTVIIFAADQGFAWGQKGFRRKLAPYDATIRGPLIFSWPGHYAEGEVCAVPAGGQDLAPTIFAAAGIDLPWKMDGHNLTPLLEDPEGEVAANWEEPVLMVYTGQQYGSNTDVVPDDPKLLAPAGVPWWVSLVTPDGRYKYIRTMIEGEPEELYDLVEDPEELVNLARDAGYGDRVVEMRERTLAEMKKRGAGLAEAMPEVAALPEG
ncbi:MAG: sulfatase-like hydrolase/transferase [Verrucomicrobiota bacterium]